jgi:integrase
VGTIVGTVELDFESGHSMPTHLLNALRLKARHTQALVDAADRKVSVKISDGGGLVLVVRPSGESSWVFRFSAHGVRRDMTVGRWPTVNLALARELVAEAKRLIARGKDPLKERAELRAKNAQSDDTVLKLFEAWQTVGRHSSVYRGNIEAAFQKDVLSKIGNVAPHKVTREQVMGILREIESRDAVVMVRRVRMWLRQMFDFAIEDERRPLVLTSPVPNGTLRAFGRPRRVRHFAAITDANEIGALLRRFLAVTDNFVVRSALLFSAHVWQRPTEIREAVWAEFDLERRIWIIPAARMKQANEHWVPLSWQVVELLKVHQGVVGKSGLLFPGRRRGESISEGTLTSRLNTMGYKGRHTPHGFRAMARTLLDEHLKIDTRFIEKQLSHELSDPLRGAYNRAEYWEDRVNMMQIWSTWLDAEAATNVGSSG